MNTIQEYSQERFIRPQPISMRRIADYNPEIIHIYNSRRGDIVFRACAPKSGGTALGSICQKVGDHRSEPRRWMAKVGMPSGELRNDIFSIRSRALTEMNLDTIREKIAADIYKELGIGLFEIPKTRLATLPILDSFTMSNLLAQFLAQEQGIQNSLRVLSRFVDNYEDFQTIKALNENHQPTPFMQYIEQTHRPPDHILTPDGKPMPLTGFLELLAVARMLADTDVIGGSGGNAGIQWVQKSDGTRRAVTMKLDPGFAFQFTETVGYNMFINTRENRPGNRLTQLKDIQIANSHAGVTIHWDALSRTQKDIFLAGLINCSRYLKADLLRFFFFREGRFNRGPTERIAEEVAQKMADEMQAWMRLQLDIYQDDVRDFQTRHPDTALKIHYIDQCGELSLPMAEETFPVRDLFSELAIVSREEQEKKEAAIRSLSSTSSQTPLVHHDSLTSSWERIQEIEQAIAIDQFFEPEKGRPVHHLLLIGAAGVGKSTLCQKISHDWASGRLFQEKFKAVYWIPLRLLNTAVAPGGVFCGLEDSNLFLARTMAELVLNQPELVQPLLNLLREHPQEVLILLDGYDEANNDLRKVVKPFLENPELHILLTSRPGVTEYLAGCFDRSVENMGFAERHIKGYCARFFTRKRNTINEQQRKNAFLEKLKSQTQLFRIAHVPLQLQMLCSLWEQGADQSGFDSSVTGLYRDLIDQLFRWQCLHKEENPLDVPIDYKRSLYRLLGQIAERGLVQGKLMIPQSDVIPILESHNLTEQKLIDTGLLKVTGTGINRHYYFLHLTFQEYLVADYMRTESLEDLQAFIIENRDKPSYRLVLLFLAGAVYHNDTSRAKVNTQAFFNALCNELPSDMTNSPLLLLLFRCLNECKNYRGHLPALEQLLQAQPGILTADLGGDGTGRLPLGYWLAHEGLLHAFQWLVLKTGKGVVNQVGGWGNATTTASMIAAYKGHFELLKWLCEQEPALLQKTNQFGGTVMHQAVCHGQLEPIKWLHQLAPNLIQIADDGGKTVMHLTAARGHVAVLELLHELDCSLIERVDQSGLTVMHSAALNGHVKAMKYLHGQNSQLIQRADNSDGWTVLHIAAQKNNVRAIEWLCQQDSTVVQKKDRVQETAIHHAARSGETEALECLHRQDPTLILAVDKWGETALHWAVQRGEMKVIKWFYQKDHTLFHLPNFQGETPLHLAVLRGQQELLDWLNTQDETLPQRILEDGQRAAQAAEERRRCSLAAAPQNRAAPAPKPATQETSLEKEKTSSCRLM